jgi:flagellar basal-body rod modification protein FlgD
MTMDLRALGTGSNAGAALATELGASGASNTLGRDEFMRLLTVQLTHQDPLNPVTNEAFISQLAEFSALEQMQSINENLALSQMLDQSINNVLASSLIGREVRTTGDVIELDAGSTPELFVAIEAEARVSLSVRDAGGGVVRTLDLGVLPAGEKRILWDGKDGQGRSLPPGLYTVAASAVGGGGEPVRVDTATIGEATALRFREGRAYLVIDGRERPIDEVLEIR